MGLLQNLIKGMRGNKEEFKKKFKEAQEEKKIDELIEERSKSANRRELERYYREKEEEQIKLELDRIRKQKTKEVWRDKNLILSQKATMLRTDRPILKEKNIFSNKQNVMKKEEMFFR